MLRLDYISVRIRLCCVLERLFYNEVARFIPERNNHLLKYRRCSEITVTFANLDQNAILHCAHIRL
jgi:hypothetical protein